LEPIDELGVFSTEAIDLEWLSALESGRRFARDLCGTEPERMAPIQFAACCEEFFKGSGVKITVHQNADFLRQGYPLLSAVARASTSVSRHRPCVVRLVYEPDGGVRKSLFFAGKGVTYDTGGADIKVGGHMAGMSRDKGGAAAVAGLMAMLARIKPPHVRVVAELGLVRNSIGADAFVSDEIIKSHAGVRVRICNTDAEGRLVLADLLSHLREEAAVAPAPEVFSVATLTGHAALALGPYTALVENGPARASGIGTRLFSAGELWADPAELSSSRREDYEFVRPSSRAEDIFSSNNAPSVSTVRGHQYPMAFLSIASGLEGHGLNSSSPIPYTHMDIAGSCIEADDWKLGRPTASPIAAIAAAYFRECLSQS
jgi:leucyl aminopeptidase